MPESRFRVSGFGADLMQAARLDRRTRLDVFQATYELAVARFRLHRETNCQSLRCTKSPGDPEQRPFSREETDLVNRIAFAIPRTAQRLPWRADCLVQAMAAQRWLRRRGIAAQVKIGVRKNGMAPLDAHAWLKAGDHIVTGGDITAFTPLAD